MLGPNFEAKHASVIGVEILISLGTAVWLSVADCLAMLSAPGLTLDAVFLRSYSPFGLSAAGYVLVLLAGMGLVIGLAISLLQRVLIRAEGPPRIVISAVLTLSGLSAILCRLRTETVQDLAFMGRYISALGLLALLYVSIAISVPSLTRARSDRSAMLGIKRVAGGLTMGLALVVLSAPTFQQFILSSRPRSGNPNRRPNVLVLMLDTVRADALSCIDPINGQTPHIDEIAREGILFRKAVSPAPWTIPSHGSLFTGLYPSQHGAVWENPALNQDLNTLAEIFYEKGYRTVGFSENPSVSSVMGFAQGFEDFSDMYLNLRRALVPGFLADGLSKFFGRRPTLEYTDDTTKQFILWLRGNALQNDAPPFFAFLNYMAGHLPDYARPEFNITIPPKDVLKRVQPISEHGYRFYLPAYEVHPIDLEALRMFYRGDIAFLDSRLGLLFDFLRRKKLLDNTVLIIVSDHGENFGDHGLMEHSFSLYNTVLHVPLVIRYPAKILAGSDRSTLVSTVRLFETILDLAGMNRQDPAIRLNPWNPQPSLLGAVPEADIYAECQNLVGMLKMQLSLEPSAATFDYSPYDKSIECIFTENRKLIRSSNGRIELYDIIADWAETKDLAKEEPELVDSLLDKLAAYRNGMVIPNLDLPQRSHNPALQEALKSLGYIH